MRLVYLLYCILCFCIFISFYIFPHTAASILIDSYLRCVGATDKNRIPIRGGITYLLTPQYDFGLVTSPSCNLSKSIVHFYCINWFNKSNCNIIECNKLNFLLRQKLKLYIMQHLLTVLFCKISFIPKFCTKLNL